MKIAIQGHPTRGKEIIQILRSLGATSYGAYDTCSHPEWYWYINKNKEITCDPKRSVCGYKLYTLEEFERKFPFKIGDKVMWPVKVGWWSGIIVDLSPDYYKIIDDKCNYHFVEASKLKLYPMQKERNITLTLEKAKEWYKKGGELKEIALQAFTKEELTKVDLPKTWEEFYEQYKSKKTLDTCLYSIGVSFSIRYVNKFKAFIKLQYLRDCWIQGWEPDWNDAKQTKYCIIYYKREFKIGILCETRHFLSFPTREMAEEFLKCFKDLIEEAGDLI